MFDNIPSEIQVEIFKRLPVKSLIQLRSVSKQWKSLIDSSEFISDHSLNNTQPHHLLLMNQGNSERQFIPIVDDDDSFPEHEFSPPVPPTVKLLKQVLMVDCTHGVVCLYGFLRQYASKNLIVFWNPSIRKSVDIQLPLESSLVGVGVCPITNNPKIVTVSRGAFSLDLQADVFTLSSRVWRSVPVNLSPSLHFNKYSLRQVIINGVIHSHGYDIITKKYRIITFDLKSEEFLGEIHLPDGLESSRYLTIFNLKESLLMVKYENRNLYAPFCDVWMENDDLKSLFTKLYNGIKQKVGSAECFQIIGFKKNGDMMMELLYDLEDDCMSSVLAVYDPCSKRIIGIDRSGKSEFMITSYSESLILLNQPDSMILY